MAVVGPSGSGKSTFLQCLGGLLECQADRLCVAEQDITTLDDEGRLRHRRESLGFVFQHHLLLDELPLEENVALPLMLNGMRRNRSIDAAKDVLGQLGIGDLARRSPSQVSGGERQRAAVARALVHRPRLVLADEPTGSLDSQNSGVTADALLAVLRDRHTSLILVTHDRQLAERCDAVVTIVDGRLRR